MAYHINRDYTTQSSVPITSDIVAYIHALFLYHVLGYTQVGNTNFGPGNTLDGFTVASGTASPNLAGVNIPGASSIYSVQVPAAVWTVTAADVGSIVVLKSTANPTFNSGCFLIVGVATGASNTWVIDWRSGDTPPAETGGATGCEWWLCNTDGPSLGYYPITTVATQFTEPGAGNEVSITMTSLAWYSAMQFNDYWEIGGVIWTTNFLPVGNSVGLHQVTPGSAVVPAGTQVYIGGFLRSPNAGTGYHGDNSVGTSMNSRVILQSPHATGWQIRIACETSQDYSGANATCTTLSYTPGFGGNAAGDFPTQANGGQHLHEPMWLSTAAQGANNYQAAIAPGSGHQDTGVQTRVWIAGDDTGQAVFMVARHASAPNPALTIYGICDNEPTPLVPTIQRIFVIASGNGTNNGQNLQCNFSGGSNQNGSGMVGITWGYFNGPVSAVPSVWTFIEGTGQGSGPTYNANAADSPFVGGTELMRVDCVAGTTLTWSNQSGSPTMFQLPDIRLIGTLPWCRCGRANFPAWTATSDAGKAWFHHVNGVFMQYGGPTPEA